MQVYDRDFRFHGRHAKRVSQLVSQKFFSYNYELMYTAPIYGLLRKRSAELDHTKEEESEKEIITKVPTEQVIGNQSQIRMAYFLVMLNLPEIEDKDFKTHADKLFRKVELTTEDRARFEGFMRGGIDALYEELVQNCPDNPVDQALKVAEIVREFDLISTVIGSEKLVRMAAGVADHPTDAELTNTNEELE